MGSPQEPGISLKVEWRGKEVTETQYGWGIVTNTVIQFSLVQHSHTDYGRPYRFLKKTHNGKAVTPIKWFFAEDGHGFKWEEDTGQTDGLGCMLVKEKCGGLKKVILMKVDVGAKSWLYWTTEKDLTGVWVWLWKSAVLVSLQELF